jgi:hypothetical protein
MSEIAYRLRMSAIVQLLCLVLLCIGGAAPALAEARLALVIGNSAYKVGALANPRNDAALMADALREVGFEVATLSDATKDQMKQALLAFSRKLRETGAVGLFYYAGHGVQLRGENFVIPVDADIQNEAEVEFLALNVNEFLSAMERTSNQINIVILDACRNNPFARSFRSAASGLATVDAPRGSYIAYATAPGQVALDGDKGNSPYASALAAAIRTPGLTLEDTFKKARREVLAATADQQIPWDTSSITGSFYFAGAAPTPAVAIAPPPVRTDRPALQIAPASPPAKVATAVDQQTAPAAVRRLSLQPQIQPVGKWPEGIAFNGKSLWVADSGQRAIRQITPGGAGRSVTVGRLPVGMVAAPDGRILVAVQTDKLIWVQSGETGKPLARLKECIEQIALAQSDLLVVTQPDCSSASSKLVAIDFGSGKARSSQLLGSDASDVVVVDGRALGRSRDRRHRRDCARHARRRAGRADRQYVVARRRRQDRRVFRWHDAASGWSRHGHASRSGKPQGHAPPRIRFTGDDRGRRRDRGSPDCRRPARSHLDHARQRPVAGDGDPVGDRSVHAAGDDCGWRYAAGDDPQGPG